ncbi:MAG: hypothetical protein ACKVII_12280 [Planctomycetales bacterium]|jgi:hypothetical protein
MRDDEVKKLPRELNEFAANVVESIHRAVDRFDLQRTEPLPGDSSAMGGWYVGWENSEFVASASQDRSGDVLAICIGSRIRRRPRAQMRGPWSLSHLRGHLEGTPDHYIFESAEDQITWLESNLDRLLNSSFLNSDELNAWAVNASRRRYGQRSRS